MCSALPFNTYQYYTPFVPPALKLYTVYTEAWFFHLSTGGASRMQLVPEFRGSGISWWLAHKKGWGTPKVHGADVYWCHLWCPIRKLHNVENHDDDPMRITDTRLASMSTESQGWLRHVRGLWSRPMLDLAQDHSAWSFHVMPCHAWQRDVLPNDLSPWL